MYGSFLFYLVTFRRHKAVFLHNVSECAERNINAFKIFKALAEVRKVYIRILAGIEAGNFFTELFVNFCFGSTSGIAVFKNLIAIDFIFFTKPAQMNNCISS